MVFNENENYELYLLMIIKRATGKDYLEICHVFISLRVQTVQIEWCLLRWDIEHRLLRLKLLVPKFLCFKSFLTDFLFLPTFYIKLCVSCVPLFSSEDAVGAVMHFLYEKPSQ